LDAFASGREGVSILLRECFSRLSTWPIFKVTTAGTSEERSPFLDSKLLVHYAPRALPRFRPLEACTLQLPELPH